MFLLNYLMMKMTFKYKTRNTLEIILTKLSASGKLFISRKKLAEVPSSAASWTVVQVWSRVCYLHHKS